MVNFTSVIDNNVWWDEVLRWNGVGTPVVSEVQSKIRVTFNRPLTYSEREHLRVNILSDVKLRFEGGSMLWVRDYASDDSRDLFNVIAKFVEKNFVNVHPVAVKTVIPEVKV